MIKDLEPFGALEVEFMKQTNYNRDQTDKITWIKKPPLLVFHPMSADKPIHTIQFHSIRVKI
jgi:hypothetical protein